MAKQDKNDIKSDENNVEIYTLSKSKSSNINEEIKSKQKVENVFSSEGADIVDPAYDFDDCIKNSSYNTRLNRLLRVLSRNIAGIDYIVESKLTKEELKKLSDDKKIDIEKEKVLIDEERKILKDFLDNCNDEMTFVELLNLIEYEKQITGNCFLEIVRDTLKKKPKKLYHVPVRTIRKRKEDKGFVQIIEGKKIYFKKFGEEGVIDNLTGINITKEKELNEIEKENLKNFPIEDNISPERIASEILHNKIYSPEDLYYGVPVWITTIRAILGNKSSATRNLAFFENDATPRSIINIVGGKVSQDAIDSLSNFIEASCKGIRNASRSIIINTKKLFGNGDDPPEIKITPLTVGKTEDETHQNYRMNNDEEIRESIGLGKVFLGTADDVNRASAIITRQIANQQEIEPQTNSLEHLLNKSIVEKGLELTKVKIKIIRPKTSDDLDISLVIKNLTDSGAITINESRKLRNQEELDAEKYPWADKPLVIVLKEMDLGISDFGQLPEAQALKVSKLLETIREKANKSLNANIELENELIGDDC